MKTKQFLVILTSLLIGASAVSADLLGEYNFNDTGSGTIAERMPVAMGASSVIAGATFSELLTNTTTVLTFAGFNNMPGGNYDCYSFGNAGGAAVIFLKRSESGFDTAYDKPDTSTDVQPLNFTVGADASSIIVVSNITIHATWASGSAVIFRFQEADAAVGTDSAEFGGDAIGTIDLDSPVSISAGSSKAFTIHLNSYVHGAQVGVDYIQVNGAVIPEPFTIGLLGFGAFGLMILRRK